MKKIGGDFEMKNELFLNNSSYQNHCLEYWKNNYFTFTNSGRAAIALALTLALAKGISQDAYLPYYCCESIRLAFKKKGFNIHYYSMGQDLQSPKGLPERLKGVFFFIHYFGKQNTNVIEYLNLQLANRSDFLIIEDCVQTCLSKIGGELGDFCIHSLRKFAPLPDAALLTSRVEFSCTLDKPDEEYVSSKWLSKLLRAHNNDHCLQLYEYSESILDECQPRTMSWISNYLIKQLDLDDFQKKRRENWLYLANCLECSPDIRPIIKPLYKNLERDEVPLIFPIQVSRHIRDHLKNHLAKQKIYTPIHWKLKNDVLDNSLCAGDMQLSESILGLPIDHRVSKEDIEWMINEIKFFMKKLIDEVINLKEQMDV